jgi:hypothetical protein
VTRDYPTGDGNTENTVRRVRARYELDSSESATIAGDYADGTTDLTGLSLWDTALWDTAIWEEEQAGEWVSMAGTAPEDSGREPFAWPVNRRVRYIRFRLRCMKPATRLILRGIELLVRPTNKR